MELEHGILHEPEINMVVDTHQDVVLLVLQKRYVAHREIGTQMDPVLALHGDYIVHKVLVVVNVDPLTLFIIASCLQLEHYLEWLLVLKVGLGRLNVAIDKDMLICLLQAFQSGVPN